MTDLGELTLDLATNGTGLPTPLENGGSHHGWQKVTNPKKQKRQEARSKGQAPRSLTENGKRNGNYPENKAFQALEKEAEERRVHREALLQAVINGSTSASAADVAHSDSDAEGDEEHPHAEANGAANGDLKRSKPKKPKKPKVTVAEAAAAIDASDLAAFLTQISESFAELPDVQLMRFADYFGRAFSAVTPTQFGWNKILKESSVSKAVQLPLLNVPEPVCKTASDWLAARPLDALGDFVIWGLNDVLNDAQPHHGTQKGSKGGSVNSSSKTKVAVLIVLALALRKRPEALVQKATLLRTNPQYQGQEKLAMLAWAYGQVAQGDLVAGMQLWVQNLLPLACGKASTPVARDITLQFAESILFSNLKKARSMFFNAATRKGERLVPPATLVSLMYTSFPSDSARTKATERFQGLYPVVKEIALHGSGSKATKTAAHNLLPQCLEAAGAEDAPSLVREACDLAIWCLSENTDCCKQWEKLHPEKLQGSVKLLSYMCVEWARIVTQLSPLDNMKKTIAILRVQNHTAMEKARGNAKQEALLRMADKHCKVLKKRLARGSACFKAMATVVAGVGIAYGFYLLNLDLPLLR